VYQREVEYELKTLGAQIEPILILCLGVLGLLILALGVFLPIWDLGRRTEEMTLRALLARGHQCGVSFLEFAVCMALVGISWRCCRAGAVLPASMRKRPRWNGPRGTSAPVCGTSGDLISPTGPSEIQTLADREPDELLAERPPNYLGELDSAPRTSRKVSGISTAQLRAGVHGEQSAALFAVKLSGFQLRYRAMRVSVGSVNGQVARFPGTWVSLCWSPSMAGSSSTVWIVHFNLEIS